MSHLTQPQIRGKILAPLKIAFFDKNRCIYTNKTHNIARKSLVFNPIVAIFQI